jgi:Raf kinase inhibitor-like YbhB/YbcL family protein
MCGVASLAGCKSDGRALKPASPDQSLSIVVPTTVPPTTLPPAGGSQAEVQETLPAEVSTTALSLSGSWVDGDPLPPDSTCKGKGLSPDLKWTNVPANATELVLTVTDADASGFVHWVLAGIDPATPGLSQGKIPRGTVQTLNSAPAIGWFAPCPPQGTHRYIFSLFVLTKPSGILAGMDPTDALAGLSAPGIQRVAITGTVTT